MVWLAMLLRANEIAEAYRTNRRVIVDLSRVEYFDASGIHVLETCAWTHESCFVVVGSKPKVHRLFGILEILELTNVLPVVASLDAARTACASVEAGSSEPATVVAFTGHRRGLGRIFAATLSTMTQAVIRRAATSTRANVMAGFGTKKCFTTSMSVHP
jgi:anti-anti-sigma regulatory factor